MPASQPDSKVDQRTMWDTLTNDEINQRALCDGQPNDKVDQPALLTI